MLVTICGQDWKAEKGVKGKHTHTHMCTSQRERLRIGERRGSNSACSRSQLYSWKRSGKKLASLNSFCRCRAFQCRQCARSLNQSATCKGDEEPSLPLHAPVHACITVAIKSKWLDQKARLYSLQFILPCHEVRPSHIYLLLPSKREVNWV